MTIPISQGHVSDFPLEAYSLPLLAASCWRQTPAGIQMVAIRICDMENCCCYMEGV